MKTSILLIVTLSLICNLIAITGFQQTVYAEKEIAEEESEEWNEAQYEEEKAKNLKQEYTDEEIEKVVEDLKNNDDEEEENEDEE